MCPIEELNGLFLRLSTLRRSLGVSAYVRALRAAQAAVDMTERIERASRSGAASRRAAQIIRFPSRARRPSVRGG
jgi:hypothetical protein